jgi:hypothetical protein
VSVTFRVAKGGKKTIDIKTVDVPNILAIIRSNYRAITPYFSNEVLMVENLCPDRYMTSPMAHWLID